MPAPDQFPPSWTRIAPSAVDAEVVADVRERVAQRRQRIAEGIALDELAERECPADLIAYGERHGLPAFARATWQAGFAAGWKAALAHLARRETENEP